jgi:hypothetical protein
MLPRRHAINLLMLGIPWCIVILGILRGPSGSGGVLDIGDMRPLVARLLVAAYATQAALSTLLIAALNWRRLRPGSAAIVYLSLGWPSILVAVLALLSALSPPSRH